MPLLAGKICVRQLRGSGVWWIHANDLLYNIGLLGSFDVRDLPLVFPSS